MNQNIWAMYDYDIIYRIRRFYENKNKTLSQAMLELDSGRILMDDICGIELPWKGNRRNVSRIKAGIYKAQAVSRYSNGKYAILLYDVPGRSEIMIHEATFVRHLQGCIAPGTNFADLDRDGIIDVEDSFKVMQELERLVPLWTRLKVEIIDDFPKPPPKKLSHMQKLLKIIIPSIC